MDQFLDSTVVNFRSKINVLENISVQPPTILSSQPGTSTEDKFMKHLNDLAKAQKAYEERQSSFETRIEQKLDAFLNDHLRMQGSSRSIQNQSQRQSQENARLNDHFRMQSSSHSTQNQTHQQRQEPAHPVHEAIPDFDDFEEFDQNFPIDEFENVAELENNIRKDLELKFLLVILYFHIYVMFSVCKQFFFLEFARNLG